MAAALASAASSWEAAAPVSPAGDTAAPAGEPAAPDPVAGDTAAPAGESAAPARSKTNLLAQQLMRDAWQREDEEEVIPPIPCSVEVDVWIKWPIGIP